MDIPDPNPNPDSPRPKYPLVNKGGRFALTIEDLPKDWEQLIYDLAQKGKGKIAWCIALKISPPTFDKFTRNDKDFGEVYQIAKLLEQSWWEDAGQLMVTTGRGAQAVYNLMMKTKFGWEAPTTIKKYTDQGKIESIQNGVFLSDLMGTNDELEDAPLNREQLFEELKRRGLPTTMFEKKFIQPANQPTTSKSLSTVQTPSPSDLPRPKSSIASKLKLKSGTVVSNPPSEGKPLIDGTPVDVSTDAKPSHRSKEYKSKDTTIRDNPIND